VDKRTLSSVEVVNNTKAGLTISSEYINVVLNDIAPVLEITAGSWISENDSLTITSIEGNVIYINGEQITFSGVDVASNTLTGIARGVNGTAQQYLVLSNTTVIGLLPAKRLPDEYYNQTWNSAIYNPIEGDPLQISNTAPAMFLNTQVS
jgi:hypothetical protein